MPESCKLQIHVVVFFLLDIKLLLVHFLSALNFQTFQFRAEKPSEVEKTHYMPVSISLSMITSCHEEMIGIQKFKTEQDDDALH